MVKGGGKQEPYNLDPRFERVAATLTCTSRSFFKRIGGSLHPDGFVDEPAQLAVRAALAIGKESGAGPASSVVVLQRLRRWMSEGRVTLEQIQAVGVMIDEVEDQELDRGEDAIIMELVPILRHQYEREAAHAAVETYSNKGDWSRVTSLVERARSVGVVDTSPGITFGADAFSELAKMKELSFLPTGIMELDAFLDGGLRKGGEGVVIGSAGAGKSMFLSQATANAVHLGQNACIATLELPEGEQLARLVANLTGIPTKAVLDGRMSDARRIVTAMEPQIGKCVVKYFTPQVTTVEDVLAWKMETEQRLGQPVALLTVDYADKLTTASAGKHDNDYKLMNKVYEKLRINAEQTGSWTWTASQAKRGDKKRKRIDLDDVSDSMGKVRVADLVITLGIEDQQQLVSFFIAKNRTGRALATVGPLPTDFPLGRIAVPASARQDEPF